MSQDLSEENKFLEEKFQKALEEAWSKAQDALKEIATEGVESEKRVWLAAEAAEYSSALYSLRHDLEDFDPDVAEKKGADRHSLVKEALTFLQRVRRPENESPKETYRSLRQAVHLLRRAYLGTGQRRRRRQSLTMAEKSGSPS